MIGTYIVLFLMAVLAGMVGGLIAHVIYGKIQERKLRNWKPKKKRAKLDNSWVNELLN